MKRIIIILSLLVFAMPTFSFAQLIACRDSIPNGYDFWLYLPDDYNDTVREKPLVILLHGRSLCGKNLANVKRYGCIDAIERGRNIDAVVVAPQCTPGCGIVSHCSADCAPGSCPSGRQSYQ